MIKVVCNQPESWIFPVWISWPNRSFHTFPGRCFRMLCCHGIILSRCRICNYSWVYFINRFSQIRAWIGCFSSPRPWTNFVLRITEHLQWQWESHPYQHDRVFSDLSFSYALFPALSRILLLPPNRTAQLDQSYECLNHIKLTLTLFHFHKYISKVYHYQ